MLAQAASSTRACLREDSAAVWANALAQGKRDPALRQCRARGRWYDHRLRRHLLRRPAAVRTAGYARYEPTHALVRSAQKSSEDGSSGEITCNDYDGMTASAAAQRRARRARRALAKSLPNTY
jgi:hypothetical protein